MKGGAIMRCPKPYCQSDDTIRYQIHDCIQVWHCRTCGSYFRETARTPYYRSSKIKEEWWAVILNWADGMGAQRNAKKVGLGSKNTITHMIRVARDPQYLSKLVDEMRDAELITIEQVMPLCEVLAGLTDRGCGWRTAQTPS